MSISLSWWQHTAFDRDHVPESASISLSYVIFTRPQLFSRRAGRCSVASLEDRGTLAEQLLSWSHVVKQYVSRLTRPSLCLLPWLPQRCEGASAVGNRSGAWQHDWSAGSARETSRNGEIPRRLISRALSASSFRPHRPCYLFRGHFFSARSYVLDLTAWLHRRAVANPSEGRLEQQYE